MNTTIREIAASIIERATKEPNYSAVDLAVAISEAAYATTFEIVTYAKVRDFVSAVNDAIAIADGITLNPRYDSIRADRRDPAIYGKYNTGVFAHCCTGGVYLMGYEYNTPAESIIMLACKIGSVIVDMNGDFMDAFLDDYNMIYTGLYEGRINLTRERSSELIDRFDGGDYNRDVLLAFNERRQDIVSSDREAMAFMLAYDRCVTK